MAGPRWVDGTIDGLSCIKMLQSTYRDALTKHDLDPNKCLLQQDGAPPHGPAIKGLKGIINIMMHWPPNIPGLNIIETGGGLIAESGKIDLSKLSKGCQHVLSRSFERPESTGSRRRLALLLDVSYARMCRQERR